LSLVLPPEQPPYDGAQELFSERIEDTEAPFWAHVRDALAERNP
jgi:hypothetical protein